ncbi:MAG: DUF948 domain-containing protein [Clostridiaceae bacterium]|jgi:23S rRNA G2069 N7-methylase RlmK/C1962 C5-methylase RlmI|nr:DUF948 domain-containing protein [Clostridiaceae bacterium]
MFNEMISWGELIVLVLFVLGSALIFYLILAVVNLLRILKNVNQIIEKNKDNINKTVENLPEITENTAKITGMVKDNLDGLGKVVEDVGKISETVKKGAETIQKDIVLKAKSILDIIDAVKTMYEKRKSKSKKKSGTVYKYKYKPGINKPDEVEVETNEIHEQDIAPDDYVKVEPEANEEPMEENVE